MSGSHRCPFLSIVLSLLCAGCGGSSVAVPSQSSSPTPPTVLARGTVAVVDHTSEATRILIFPRTATSSLKKSHSAVRASLPTHWYLIGEDICMSGSTIHPETANTKFSR